MAPGRTYGRQSQAVGSSRRAAPPEPSPAPESEEDDDELDEAEYQQQDGGEVEATQGGMSEAQLKTAASQLVRFALFQEYKRRPLNRADIVKTIFPSHSRAFNAVMERAKKIIRRDFGMEIVELRSKYKSGDELANGAGGSGAAGNNKGKRRAENGDEADDVDGHTETQRPAKKARATGSKTYAIRSILPRPLIEAMSDPNPLPRINMPEEEVDEDGQYVTEPDSGALLRWEKGDGTASGSNGLLGIRMLVLSVILTLGRVVTDDHLHALLRRLNLYRETVLPYRNPDHREPPLTLDKYLDLLARQGYLEKLKIPAPAGAHGEGESAEWRWGGRADMEFSEAAASEFIERIFDMTGEDDPSENEEDNEEAEGGRRGRGGRQNRRAQEPTFRQSKAVRKEKLKKDIARAAGSELTGSL